MVVSSPAHVRAAVVGHAAPPATRPCACRRATLEGEGEEEPAFEGFETGEVALPDEAGPIRRGHPGQPVFGDGVSVPAVGGARPQAALLPGPEAFQGHEPGAGSPRSFGG